MYYWVYGFALKSDFELPELREITREEAEAGPPPMVEIVNGPVSDRLLGEIRLAREFSYAGGVCLYDIPNIGRIQVEYGSRIVFDMAPRACKSDVRTYLLGSGLGTICHQRGLVPLHVSSVLSPMGAVAFSGFSGAGKSTAAAAFHARMGWPVVSDDVAVLSLKNDSVFLEGGVRRLRLCRDALDRLEWPKKDVDRLRAHKNKSLVLAGGSFLNGPASLFKLIEICDSQQGEASAPISGYSSFETLLNAIYRPFMVGIAQKRSFVHAQLASAARQVRIEKASREGAIKSTEK